VYSRRRQSIQAWEIKMEKLFPTWDEKPTDSGRMIAYVSGHFRYWTGNSWNQSTSYAHNVKIPRLGLDSETRDKCYAALDIPQAFDEVNEILEDFAVRHNYAWKISFNDRSGGYLVLYQGGVKDNKSFVYPVRGVGEMDWVDGDFLTDLVDVIWDFDETCQRAVEVFVEFAVSHTVVEEEIMVSKTVLVAISNEDANRRESNRLWESACQFDGYDPDEKFVCFSDENPFTSEYNARMIERLEYSRQGDVK